MSEEVQNVVPEPHRKEGLIICITAIAMGIIVTMFSDFQMCDPWRLQCHFDFGTATLWQFSGFGENPNEMFHIYSVYIYALLTLLLAYGICRCLGIVRRLLPWEEALLNRVIK